MSANYWRVSFISTGGAGETIITGFHLKADALLTDAWDPPELVAEVETWLKTKYLNILTSDDRLNEIQVLEHLSDPTGVPRAASKFPAAAGVQAGMDGKLPREACVWVNIKTGVPLRAARSGHHLPPWRHSGWLSAQGSWNTGAAIWPFVNAWCDALKAGRDTGSPHVGGHLSTVAWSETRVRRSQTPHVWDANGVLPSTKVAWLRSRYSIP